MKELIDKAAVVAELERLISNGQTKLKESEECKDYESYVALAERIATCINVLSFLGTLEVKEVELDLEITLWANAIPEIRLDDVERLAKYFFELGLKAKGE